MNAPTPQLSVVVVPTNDTIAVSSNTCDLSRNLQALREQINPPAMEIIVPYHAKLTGIDDLAIRFTEVVFLKVNLSPGLARGPSREHHDVLRARGVEAASAPLVACLEEHVYPEPTWAREIVNAHNQPFAAIGGAIENGLDHPLNWAVYFCDLGRYQNPLMDGDSDRASLVNVSYKRSALDHVRPTWESRFNETEVNRTLVARGEKLALCSRIIVYQFRQGLSLQLAVREFRVWGRSYARTRRVFLTNPQRCGLIVLWPILPALLLVRLVLGTVSKRRSIRAFLQALPLIALLIVSWSWGELIGYVLPLTTHQPRIRDVRC